MKINQAIKNYTIVYLMVGLPLSIVLWVCIVLGARYDREMYKERIIVLEKTNAEQEQQIEIFKAQVDLVEILRTQVNQLYYEKRSHIK